MKRPGTQAVKEMTISTDFCKAPLWVAQQVFLPLKQNINGALDLHPKLDLHVGFVMHQPLSPSINSAKYFLVSCF